ncbi:MAG: iron-sulfur cluster repair di-iron protein [Fulvivirga sp.]|nr:iron-sulfur cluster repair di-iron protein [Fulvivirga sp.]
MEKLKNSTIGSLVTEDYHFADVFKRYGIDFCCGGNITVKEACSKNNLDYQEVLYELEAVEQIEPARTVVNDLTPDQLADHIITQHHTYVRQNLPLIIEYADKVASVHGERHPELLEINQLLLVLDKDLSAHMNKEEVILFPYIKELVTSGIRAAAPFGSVENPIRTMMEEHDNAGSIMKSIALMSSQYTPPEDACTTYRVLYQKLEEFENDLHRHIHLENNILFPKAVALELQQQQTD